MIKYSLIFLFMMLQIIYVSCEKENDTGSITFGANYHQINTTTQVDIYIDDLKVGRLTGYTDTIVDCGEPQNLTLELPVGKHSYLIKILPYSDKTISDTIDIRRDQCQKVFIDYYKIFSNHVH